MVRGKLMHALLSFNPQESSNDEYTAGAEQEKSETTEGENRLCDL